MCYRYRGQSNSNCYLRRNCKGHSSIIRSVNGDLVFQEAKPNHPCRPSKYNAIIRKPYFEFVITEANNSMAYAQSGDEFIKYSYIQTHANIYQCLGCKKLNEKRPQEESNNVYASVWKDENGEEYVQLTGTHKCKPIEYLTTLPSN
uniref:Uncharacterized protein n=1 Tax=Panagrolaimus sp. ES5 TaxID=591445 RepID=A0AC34G366_9BILA